MTDAFIYDHVRTPRGRGKVDGSLHSVPTLQLAAVALKAIKERNHLKENEIDDVVMGCVDPVGEAGGDIARAAALCAGYGNGVPGVQINRFCASGLDAVNFAAAEEEVGVGVEVADGVFHFGADKEVLLAADVARINRVGAASLKGWADESKR